MVSLLLPTAASFNPSLPLLLLFHPSAYKWIHGELRGNIPLQYLAWVSYPLMFILFSSIFCHLVSPQAIGLYLLMHHSFHLPFWSLITLGLSVFLFLFCTVFF